jgi:hypothetical protein
MRSQPMSDPMQVDRFGRVHSDGALTHWLLQAVTAAFPVVVECELAAPAINIEALKIIADWRVDLTSRIRRAQLRFELAGLDAEHIEELAEDVAAFKKCCRCLCGRPEIS